MMRRLDSSLVLWAALIGIGGVASAAAAAHLTNTPSLNAASLILLAHAPAIIACLVAIRADHVVPAPGRLAALLLAFGATLFSADIALRVFDGTPLFPMAAPSGGVILIIGWGILGLGAALRLFAQRHPRDNDKTLG
ncbi:MAG: hypothetical protein RLZ07_1824 [Pseudomonadota bacterium]